MRNVFKKTENSTRNKIFLFIQQNSNKTDPLNIKVKRTVASDEELNIKIFSLP
jgi:hypothetical protein